MTDIHCQRCGRFIGKADSMWFGKCQPCKLWQSVKVDTGRVVYIPFRQSRVSA